MAEDDTFQVPQHAGSPPREGDRASRRLALEWVVIPACIAAVLAVVLVLALLL
jgi:hypothetical protein